MMEALNDLAKKYNFMTYYNKQSRYLTEISANKQNWFKVYKPMSFRLYD